MLTGQQLRVKATRKTVKPSFIDPERPSYVQAAEALIDLAKTALESHLTRGELDELVEDEIVGTRSDHKLLRGLSTTLQKRCTFDTESPIPAEDLRKKLFSPGPAARTQDLGVESADERVEKLALELNCSPDAIKRGLFADLKENQLLLEAEFPTPQWLINRYNISLVQGLLMFATDLELTLISPDPKELRFLFRYIKFHQLMYRITKTSDGYKISLDGPLSLFRLSTRYGRSLASFFPIIPTLSTSWSLKTTLKYNRLNRIMELSSSDNLVSHIDQSGTWISREEAWLEERFNALNSGWKLTRSGEILPFTDNVIIPDFVFEKDGKKAYLELIGIWRKGYLTSRKTLLKQDAFPNLVFVVSNSLLSDKSDSIPDGPILGFKSAIPAKKVLELIEKYAR